MKQHGRPPAVRFPLVEHRLPAVALLLALLGGVALLLLWRWQQDFRAQALLALWLAGWAWLFLMTVLGWRWWQALPRGMLCWTGEHWLLRERSDMASLHEARHWQVRLVADLQSVVLLHLEPVAAVAVPAGIHGSKVATERWVCVQRSAAPAAWLGLRQALVWSQQQQGRPLSPELSA